MASDPVLTAANAVWPAVQSRRHWLALACLLAAMHALVSLGTATGFDAVLYALTLAGACLAVTALLWNQPVTSGRLVIVGAAAAHALTLIAIPDFIDDYFRFVWDGWRTLQTGTPYGVAPDTFFADDTVPRDVRAMLDSVNNPEYPTIYGPTLQIAFAGVFLLFGPNPVGLQLLFAGVNLLIIAMLLRRHPPGAVALYAWNPLVIADSSLHLHPDGLLSGALLAALLAGRKHPVMAGVILALAAGVKLVALAAWPLLLRLRPAALVSAIGALGALYAIFLLQGRGAGFETTAAFAQFWHFNPLAYEALLLLLPDWQTARLAAVAIAGLIVLFLHARSLSLDDVPLAAIFGVILLFAPAINSWYLIWLLPFAVGRGQSWPFAATVALPFAYLTGLTLDDPALELFEVHPLARITEIAILAAAVGLDWRSHRRRRAATPMSPTPMARAKIAVVIPALDEEAAVGRVVTGVRTALGANLHQLIVADNGSTDGTAQAAYTAGATVISEPERGYGAACLAGLAALDPAVDIVLFVDSDGSDRVADAGRIVAPLIAGHADLVIGSRVSGLIEAGAMTVPQRFGNWLAPLLVWLIWGVRYSDLGPFRAIRRDALVRLAMQDRDFGWTIEMQVRAAKRGLRIAEVPTDYRRRVGVSKISGTVRGVLLAGTKILYVIGREAFGDFGSDRSPQTLAPHEHPTAG